jgi:hypothetical protein
LRSTSIPGSGREWSGANRKKDKTTYSLSDNAKQKNNKMGEDDSINEEEGNHVQNKDSMDS